MADTRLLRHFLAVFEHRNMTAAARALHITQPALTKSIRRLEEELDVHLFERQPSGVEPTRYGHVLARRAIDELGRAFPIRVDPAHIKLSETGHERVPVALAIHCH